MLVLALSSPMLAAGANVSHAHEVMPTIGDLAVEAGEVTLALRLNLEAFVAGLDLDGLADTNVAEGAEDYDRLRALEPGALEQRLRDRWPELAQGMELRADGVAVPLRLDAVEAGPVGDVELLRPSRLLLAAQIPPDTRSLSFGWGAGFGELVLRQQGVEEPFTGYIEGGTRSPEIPLAGGAAAGPWEAFASYVPVGFDHILPKGLDHILFVLGLFFLSARLKPLLWQVTAFTAAHTVTLALGALGLVAVDARIVEPLIAASIVFVAVENLFSDRLHRWRPAVIFGFGLLHGLGFASVLGEFGLPEDQFIPALIGFNVGVELGQITVIALAFLAVGAWFRHRDWYRAAIAMPASGVIALVGAWWFVERVWL